MAIVKTVDFRDFVREFELFGRQKNFSHNGLRALFDYLEELSEDVCSGYELDVIQLCCDYSEDSYSDISHNYGIDLSDCEDEIEIKATIEDYLQDHTCIVGEVDNGFVYAAF